MKVNITKDSDFKINPAIRYGATSRVDQLISSDYNEKQESSLLLLDNDPRVKFYISFINPQLLASVLNDDSIFEYLEILKCLKEQDLVRVLDFDLWNYSKDKSTWLISGDRFSHWVSAWRNISPSFSASRVFDIPEEMIVPLMRSVFEIIAIGIGQEPFSDDWTITPDNRFYYKVNAAFDTETQNIFTNLVKDIYEEDFLYSGTLFSHVCFLDINESLDLAVKWREIRLEEAGFPSMETSSRFLIAQDLNKLSNDFSHPQIPIAESDHFNTYFLESWVESVEMKLSSVPPEDFQFWETVTQVIGHGKDVVSLLQVNNHTQVNNHNDLLEEINSNDSLKEQFINSLINDYVSTYYDLLSPITLMNNHSLNEELIVFKILKHLLLTHNRNSLIQYEIQFLHIINCLKISLSDFEFFSIQKCQTFTISTINLGIEYLLNKNSLSGNFDSQLSESMFWVKSKGFTQLFQLGWSLLSDMRYRLALQVQANLESSDTSSLTHIVFKEDLKAIIKHNKFKLLEKFVMSRLSKSSPSLEHAILGLIAPMPGVSSVILSETNQVSGFYNDISIVNHLNLVQNFIDNLIYNKES